MKHPISIIDLQYFQELHDRRYHSDIHSLPLMRRLSHLHQHLVKYSRSKAARNLTFHDALACLLSMANAVNLNITLGFIEREYEINTLADVKQELVNVAMAGKYQQALGDMAKLLEASDHTENLNYRTQLQDVIIKLFNLLIQIAVYTNGTSGDVLTMQYVNRIFELKKKSIFYGFYHVEEMATQPTYQSFHRLISQD